MQSRAALDVLIVDDSDTDAKLIVLELRRRGFSPKWERVESEPALREALSRRRWDVLLSDSGLPSMGVMQALTIARELAPAVPFIVVSGAITEDVARALRAGATDYIIKSALDRLAPAVVRQLALARISGQQIEGTNELLRPLLAGLKRSIERARKERGASQTSALAEAASLVEQAISRTRGQHPDDLGPAGPREDVPMAALTPRQVQILQLIAEGYSTKQMAARLEISAKTVESHRAQIMQRLDIHHVAGLVHYALRRGIVRS